MSRSREVALLAEQATGWKDGLILAAVALAYAVQDVADAVREVRGIESGERTEA
jgi:hypothetical protein